MKSYYVVVELRDYNDKVIARHDSNCESDISNDSIISSANHAARQIVDHHNGLKMERKEKG